MASLAESLMMSTVAAAWLGCSFQLLAKVLGCMECMGCMTGLGWCPRVEEVGKDGAL